MKVMRITKYGKPAEVLRVEDAKKPEPADGQVLVKVHATSLNVTDLAPIRGAFIARLLGSGWRKPKRDVLCSDLAGRVEAVGPGVTRFKPGDAVLGAAPGTLSEFTIASENRLVLKPGHVSFESAAAVPVAGVSALQGLNRGGIRAGMDVLVHGASGAVGTFAIQIAKTLGAEVTAVCSTQNVEQAYELGAAHVIDYRREDFTRSGRTYDLVLAVNGDRSPRDYRDALKPGGRCVVLGGSMRQVFRALAFGPFLSRSGGRSIGFMGIARITREDLETLAGMLASGAIRPAVERVYAFEKAAEAVTHLESGHARGKIVIAIQNE